MNKQDTNYFDPNYVQRLCAMMKGLRMPRNSRAYKEAKIELQRLTAPFTAILLPAVMAALLAILSDSSNATEITTTVSVIEELTTKTDIEEVEPPPPPKTTELSLDFHMDSPVEVVSETLASAEAAPVASPLKTTAVTFSKSVVLPESALGRTGIGTSLGATTEFAGDLVGRLYDFKRNSDGKPRRADYWADLQRIVERKLTPRAFQDVYCVPKEIYLSHLFVPYADAATGPEAFGVGGLMEPTAWVAHYTGQVQPLHGGRYRFVGDFDDVLIVLVDGVVVLEVTWDHSDNIGGATGWTAKENVNVYKCFTGRPFIFGDWVELTSDKPRRIDVLVGERPGGRIGGVLVVQKEGVAYEKAANGFPVLPIFSVSTLSPQEQQRLAEAREMKFAFPTPVMRMAASKEVYLAGYTEADEITVDFGNL